MLSANNTGAAAAERAGVHAVAVVVSMRLALATVCVSLRIRNV